MKRESKDTFVIITDTAVGGWADRVVTTLKTLGAVQHHRPDTRTTRPQSVTRPARRRTWLAARQHGVEPVWTGLDAVARVEVPLWQTAGTVSHGWTSA